MNDMSFPRPGGFRVAYLVNQYPKVSHSFIRREIRALEQLGLEVPRIALRGWNEPIADEADREERWLTRYVLEHGLIGLLGPTLRCLILAPRRFLFALRLAFGMASHAFQSLPRHLVCLAEACRVASWLAASGARHLHAHFGTNSAEVAMLAHALSGVPYSFTVHGPEEFDMPKCLGLHTKIRHADFVVAICSYGRGQVRRWADERDLRKIHVVHCGLDRSFHQAVDIPLPVRPRLVCVGRLCEQKGQLLLVEAAAMLAGEGVSFELVLVGDGEMRPEIESAIAAARLTDRVGITGWVDGAEVRRHLLEARALVMSSFAEGLPVVIMEAMALRRPVIATYVAGIPELVRNGEDGWLVPAGDVEELASAMQACLAADPFELARMGEQARRRVLARHDALHEAARLAHLFHASAEACEGNTP